MPLDDVKESIKSRSDIVDVVGGYVTLKRAGQRFKGLCPFHSEKTPSFTVNPEKQMYYCFGCQRGGDVFHFVMEHEGVDFVGAMRLLAQQAGIPMPAPGSPHGGASDSERAADAAAKDVLYDLHERLTVWFQENLRSEGGRVPQEYLREREMSEELVAKFRLGYAPDSWDKLLSWGRSMGFSRETLDAAGVVVVTEDEGSGQRCYDRFRHRLMFPIWNEQGRVVAFSGRVLEAEQKGGKYVNSPETPIFHKGNVLYGLPWARDGIREQGYAVVCEGQIDVIACHGAGLNNAVAPQGTAFTEAQARLIKRYTDNITLAFDADDAGINAAMKAIDAFVPAGLAARVVLMDEGEDPDSIVRKHGAEALRAKFEDRRDFFMFLLDIHSRRLDADSPDGKAKIVQQVLEAVARLPNAVARGEYCQRLAGRVDIPPSFVFQELNTIRRRQQRTRQPRYEGEDEAHEPTPTPAMPLEDIVTKAESELLDLAVHHREYAQRLLEELPSEFISASPSGRALNEVLGHVEQGAWEEAEAELQERLGETPSLNRVLCAPAYGPEADPKKMEKAYRDCLMRLFQHREKEQRRDKQSQIRNAATPQEKRRLLMEMQQIRLRSPYQ